MFAISGLASTRPAVAGRSPTAALRSRISEEFRRSGAASLTMALAQNGEITWEKVWGWADKEARVPATADTSYSLASVTKSLTSTGLMIPVEKGRPRLDSPVEDYLGDEKLRAFSFNSRGATCSADCESYRRTSRARLGIVRGRIPASPFPR